MACGFEPAQERIENLMRETPVAWMRIDEMNVSHTNSFARVNPLTSRAPSQELLKRAGWQVPLATTAGSHIMVT
jgi:hypothetical protein